MEFLLTVLCTVFGLITAILIARWNSGRSWCRSRRRLYGKTVIITGANTGIGKETAKDLANRGARVIIACRDVKKGEQAAEEIGRDTGCRSNIQVYKLDLASLASIRKFAQRFLENESRLDILVNNAGLGWLKWTQSVDGYELVMATNHLGHFLLTNLLIEKLISSAPSRVVTVASYAYRMCNKINLDAITDSKAFSRCQAYCQSKLANIYFSQELARRLKDTGVTTYSLHPGTVNTEFPRHLIPMSVPWLAKVLHFILGLFCKTPTQGAQTSIYCAVAEELETVTGKYYSDCSEETLLPYATDENEARQLWEYSKRLTGL